MTASVRASVAGTLFALLVAACGSAGVVAPATPAATVPAPTEPATMEPAGAAPAATPSAVTASRTGAAPGGADVTGIDACKLLTQAEVEAALGVPLRAPFSGGDTPGVNVRSCLYASMDGNGPQVSVAVSGAPDPFRTPSAATVPELGDGAWSWNDMRGFRLEALDRDRFVAFEYNDFRSAGQPTAASLDLLVPLMHTALSRLP